MEYNVEHDQKQELIQIIESLDSCQIRLVLAFIKRLFNISD